MREALASDFELRYRLAKDRSSREYAIVRQTRAAREAHKRYVILVHGFNVIGWKAEESFDQFRDESSKISVSFAKELLSFTWPGRVHYPRALERAKVAGEVFGRFLTDLKNPAGKRPRIVLIGHSMGCRVILEALRWLCVNTTYVTRKDIDVFLMAAAVPVQLVERSETLWEASQSARRACVFHSKDDWVLRFLFPIGQSLAPEALEGVLPVAVGLRGGPQGVGVWTQAKPMKGYGHGSYWSGPEVIQDICTALKVVKSRHTPARSLADRNHQNMIGRDLSRRLM